MELSSAPNPALKFPRLLYNDTGKLPKPQLNIDCDESACTHRSFLLTKGRLNYRTFIYQTAPAVCSGLQVPWRM